MIQPRVDGSRLKLGLLLDGWNVPAWAYRALERTVHSGCATIALIATTDGGKGRTPGLRDVWRGRRRLLYSAFDALDTRLFFREPDALAPIDIRGLFPDAAVLKLHTMRHGQLDSYVSADVACIRQQSLDLMVALTAEVPRGDILNAARYGVWLYDYGSGVTSSGGPPGLWEVVEGEAETVFGLRMLGGNAQGNRLLCKSSFFTFPFSPARNRHYCLWAASSFLPRQVELLCRLGGEGFIQQATDLGHVRENDDLPLRGIPPNWKTLKLAARLGARNLRELGKRALYRDQWYLAYSLAEGRVAPFSRFRTVIPPRDRFWADPHVIQVDGTYYVFAEEYVYRDEKGHISVMQISPEGAFTHPVPVLEENYHLSYPFVFAHNGRYYMIPESADNRTVDLYECIAFPYEWQFRMHLMQDVRAVDSTLLYHEGRWWLFAGIAENEGAFPQVELFLFSSSELFTDQWRPHPMNPIVSDVKKARPAGSIFREGRRILRPSQDCSRTYGYGFDLNEILELSEARYSERTVASVRPDWGKSAHATHTLAQEGRLTLIDACMSRRRVF